MWLFGRQQKLSEGQRKSIEIRLNKRLAHVVIAGSRKSGFYWTLYSANGKPAANSAVAFKTKYECRRAAESARNAFASARVFDEQGRPLRPAVRND